MEMSEHAEGATCWADVATSDPDKTGAFYEALFGWSFLIGPPETGGYRQALIDGQRRAGLMRTMSDQQPNAWMLYFKTADAEATVATCVDAGATVMMPPHDVLDFGRMAILFDPTGAAFGIWQPDQMPGFDRIGETGAWCWSELVTSDVAAAASFYEAAFGWVREGDEMDGVGDYVQLAIDAGPVAGIMGRPDGLPDAVPNYWGLYFGVDDIESSLETVRTTGGVVAMGPMTIPFGQIAQVIDPTGASLGLIQPPA